MCHFFICAALAGLLIRYISAHQNSHLPKIDSFFRRQSIAALFAHRTALHCTTLHCTARCMQVYARGGTMCSGLEASVESLTYAIRGEPEEWQGTVGAALIFPWDATILICHSRVPRVEFRDEYGAAIERRTFLYQTTLSYASVFHSRTSRINHADRSPHWQHHATPSQNMLNAN